MSQAKPAPVFACNFVHDNMPYRLRQIFESERSRYNDFINGSSLGNFMQCYEWGELKKSSGWTPLRLFLENRDGEPLGAATILKRVVAGLPFFYTPRGPVLDYDHPDLLSLFCRAVFPLARREYAVFWRVDPELAGSGLPEKFKKAKLRPVPPDNPFGGIQPKWVWRITLTGDKEALWNGLKKGCRRQIRRAQRNGVKVKDGTEADLDAFYRLLKTTADGNGFYLRRPEYYTDLWKRMTGAHPVKVMLAYHGNKPVSTAMAVGFGRGAWDIYAGNSETDRNLGASYLLTWEMLKWACDSGFSFYDLGGIAPGAADGDPLAGLKLFKSRFGGDQVEFAGEFDLVFQPLPYRIWRWGQKGLRLVREHGKRRTGSKIKAGPPGR